MTARSRWITGWIAATALMPVTIGAAVSPALAGGGQVTICHATSSATNPFVVIHPASPAVLHAHLNHHDGADIVPPFSYKGVDYPGQNWTAEGEAISDNGCMAEEGPPPVLAPPPVLDPPELTPPPVPDPPELTPPPVPDPPELTPPPDDPPAVEPPAVEPPAAGPPSVFSF